MLTHVFDLHQNGKEPNPNLKMVAAQLKDFESQETRYMANDWRSEMMRPGLQRIETDCRNNNIDVKS